MSVVTNLADGPERVAALRPPLSKPSRSSSPIATFALHADGSGTYEYGQDGDILAGKLQLRFALEALEREIRAVVALEAPDHVFVHAGTVAHNGRAIIMPGESFAGKTTLVAALVRAGAVYLSDEFAPFDREGLVHPFPTALGLRDESSVQVDHDVRMIGGVVGVEAVPVGAVLITRYRPGADWAPERRSAGEAMLALLANTVAAQSRPNQALRAIARALESAVIIESERDEADAVAPLLLAELDRE